MNKTEETDVLIIGGGPVGLLTAYSLARQGVSSIVVEQNAKSQQEMYGRATTLFPRTLELLDQLDLLDEMNQIGCIGRSSVTYKGDKRVTKRGWHPVFDNADASFLNYCLSIRQKISESVFRERYEELGGQLFLEWKMDDFTVDITKEDDYKVTSNIGHLDSGETATIRSKYIVGADGGRSSVRQIAGIPFVGDFTGLKWVRIDGRFKTNMRDEDLGAASIESKHHGVVLFIKLDSDTTRIGYAMTPEMLAKYGESMTQEQAVAEAVKCMEPFSLEVERVDWWTLYGIKQCVADDFFVKERVLLAGDACHTHSSGAAQGMNTGVHDAVNLSWKLAGVVKGWYGPQALQTYNDERRATAQHLITLDQEFATLISGSIPDKYKGASINAAELFGKLFAESVQFNTGLGISYEESIFNQPVDSGMVTEGHRGPDALITAPGSQVPIRLHQVLKNTGKWDVIVFSGQPIVTEAKLLQSLEALKEIQSTLPKGLLRFTIIIAGAYNDGRCVSGATRIGNFYYDGRYAAYDRYSISTTGGGIVVLRPDGLVGYAAPLDDTKSIAGFFNGFIV